MQRNKVLLDTWLDNYLHFAHIKNHIITQFLFIPNHKEITSPFFFLDKYFDLSHLFFQLPKWNHLWKDPIQTTNLTVEVKLLLMDDTSAHHRSSFVQNIKQMFTPHWHPSRYFNGCDSDPVVTSVNGCKKIFLSQSFSRFEAEHENICSHEAAGSGGHPLSLPCPCLLCAVLRSAVWPSGHQWRLVSEVQVIACSPTIGEKHFAMVAPTSHYISWGRMNYFRYTMRLQPGHSCDLIAQWRLVWN